jgi:alcohol dehydrogenase
MTTRAAVLHSTGVRQPYASSRPVEILDVELAPPGPDELLIEVKAAGLCHSDLSVIDGTRPREVPLVLGHEAAGRVLGLGPGVRDFEIGDHVVLAFVPSCGSCEPCVASRPALCKPGGASNAAGTLLSGARRFSDDQGRPLNHHLGVSAFAERTVVSTRSAIKIDPAIPFETAALFGCAVMTGAGAAMNAADVRPGDAVAVFGLGGVGLSAVLGARLAGAATVIVVDPAPFKRALAIELGAAVAVDAGPEAVATIRELTDGGASKVIETVGSIAVLEDAYAATRAGGTTVTVGLPAPHRALTIPALGLVAEERTLRGSYLGSCVPARDVPKLALLHRAGQLPIDRLLTHRLNLDEINEGFDRLASGEAIRQVVTF